ncbi:hypothetical protein HOP50_14g72150 [Chloropicon primus]|uniref:Uncharacterized protein n=1 Tax=Chloropicon primus TaxID=1764295 RepID=A0A5B8MW71_9CHLO|nr:hypothetical protein A3770_14p71950 [Chloropicon primus]UPR03885.1 hypothetical protein HOP50_14g72150 [Chloropicon primus]|eukprot:QDZ24677.1 hypothetical protein A3770_14p71950 [Chloropicon primus]
MTTLYEDKFVCITEDGVEIKWYYFPCGTSKFIAFEDIKCFRLEPISLLKSKGWGMGLSNVWYACDLLRQMSNEQRRFVSLTVSNEASKCSCCVKRACCGWLNPRKGFSVENLKKVQDIMRDKAGQDLLS